MVIVVNKIDLPLKIDRRRLLKLAGGRPVVDISALKGINIDSLRREVRRIFAPRIAKNEDVILHARQKDLLRGIHGALLEAGKLLAGGRSEELAAEELRGALPLVGELTGEIRIDEVIADIFGRFCVGK
jgi:tRNA modification GTPase